MSMSARWITIVMKRMEFVLTLMDLISVAVKLDLDLMAMDSTAMVSQCAILYFDGVYIRKNITVIRSITASNYVQCTYICLT